MKAEIENLETLYNKDKRTFHSVICNYAGNSNKNLRVTIIEFCTKGKCLKSECGITKMEQVLINYLESLR